PADRVSVLPGVTSALAAPLLAGIPPTQRDVADHVVVCTGTGRGGRPPRPPAREPGRTAVFLMALHRVGALAAELTAPTAEELAEEEEEEEGGGGRGGEKERAGRGRRGEARALGP